MNIAVIAKTRLPIIEPFRGGLEAFTHTICKEYIRLGHTVTLYAHADSDVSLPIVSFYGHEHRKDQYFEAYEADEYIKILKDIESKDFDIVHNNSTHELPIIWGASARIPVVTTLHAPPQFSKVKPAVTAAGNAQNLHFVTVSAALRDMWKPYLTQKATVIYNGIDVSAWPVTKQSNDYLFWYGRMVATKGLDIALDVAHKLDMPLHFAGSIDDTTYYESQIKPRLRSDDIYLGHLQQGAIVAAMAGAAVFINAARWEEPFGLVNIEAMAAGVPIAGFDRGAFKEIVSDKSGVVASQRTVDSLAAAVQQAMSLRTDDVRARAEAFTISQMANQYINYFGTIL
jgi:glycosyltransferase involved in cell wall biosynthesis